MMIFFQVFFVITYLEICLSAFADWGELCNYTEECIDHRMICEPDDKNITKCVCNRFHKWGGRTRGCFQIYTIDKIIKTTVTTSDSEGKLAKDQDYKMRGPIFAALFLLCVVFICFFSVLCYCFHIRISDRKMMKSLKTFKNGTHSKDDKNTSFSEAVKPTHI